MPEIPGASNGFRKDRVHFKLLTFACGAGFLKRCMNKVLVVCVFLLLAGNSAVAQFRLGALAGVSVSRFAYEDDAYGELYKTRFKPGHHLGMVLNYRVNRLYSLHTELSYLNKGIDVRYEDEIVKVKNRAGFHYLSAPVLLRFSIHQMVNSQHLEFYANIGPELNYWLGGRGILTTTEPALFVKENTLPYSVSFKEEEVVGRYMVVKEPSRLQMALGAGGGVIFDLGRAQNFAVDFRASFGVGKSFHGKQEGGQYGLKLYSENLEGVHHTLSITASYLADFDLNFFFRKGKSLKSK